jgi:hypothetical protein
VLGEVGIAGFAQGVREGTGEPGTVVEWVDGEQPGVAGEPTVRRPNDERSAKKSRTCGQAGGILIEVALSVAERRWSVH